MRSEMQKDVKKAPPTQWAWKILNLRISIGGLS